MNSGIKFVILSIFLLLQCLSECAPDEREAVLIRRYSEDLKDESFQLFKEITYPEYMILDLYAQEGDEIGEFTYSICIKPDIKYIAVYDSAEHLWGYDSSVRILIDNKIIYQGSSTFTLHLKDAFVYHECTLPDTLATMSIQYAKDSRFHSFSLTCNNGTHAFDVLKVQGQIDWGNRLFSYSFCYGPNKQYAINMQTTSSKTWDKNSYIQVTNGDEVIIKTFMDHSSTGTAYFSYYPPCKTSEIEATVTRYHGSYGSSEESYDIYKGDVESGIVVFHGKGDAHSNYVTALYPVCIEAEQKYSIAYHSNDKKGWYRDNTRGFSNVKISIGSALIYGGHLESGDYGVESFVYHKSCAENEIEVTVRREYGNYPMHEPFRVFKSDADEGNHVMSLYGNSEDRNQTKVFSMCIEKEQKYSTLYYTSHDNDWTNNGVYESSVSIISENKLLESGSLTGNKKIGYGSFSYSNSCKSNEISATLLRQYSDLAHREYFELFKGKEESDSFLFGIYGMTDDSGKVLNYTICVEPNQLYTMKYGSNDQKKWSPNSFIDVQYSGFTVFHSGYHGSILSEVFTVTLPTCAGDDEWKETIIGQHAIASCQSDDYEGQRERMCNSQNNTAVWGPITDKCTLKAPVISYSQSFYNFTKTEVIDEIVPITQNRITSIAIKPSLPDGLFFNTTTGSISGTPSIYSPSTKYTITASNEEKSTSVVITISVHSVTCDKKGIWNPIGYGEIAYAFCENSSAVQYRECLLKDSNTYWGEIYDEMCSISILPEEPEKDHAFIQFELAYSEKNPENYTALNMFALYSGLYNYFDGNHMNIDGIVISTESASSSDKQEDGSVIQFSIGVSESEVETIKEGLVDYLKTSYYKDVIEKDPSFGNVPFVFNKRKMVIVYSPALSPLMIVIIIVIVICVLAIISGVVLYVKRLRRRRNLPKDNKFRVVERL